MSKNYVITNCPVAFNTRVDGTYCNDVEITNGKNIHCQYITDCVLKQIVEKCKKEITVYRNTLLPNDGTNTLHFGRQSFAYDILQFIDIQEVE